jgi:hypothetical protein
MIREFTYGLVKDGLSLVSSTMSESKEDKPLLFTNSLMSRGLEPPGEQR